MNTSSSADKAKSTLVNLPSWLQVSDIQGLAQLATHASLGVTGLAETVQGNGCKTLTMKGLRCASFLRQVPVPTFFHRGKEENQQPSQRKKCFGENVKDQKFREFKTFRVLRP